MILLFVFRHSRGVSCRHEAASMPNSKRSRYEQLKAVGVGITVKNYTMLGNFVV
jgi:hypothetical protein